jgi:hypothetical protein
VEQGLLSRVALSESARAAFTGLPGQDAESVTAVWRLRGSTLLEAGLAGDIAAGPAGDFDFGLGWGGYAGSQANAMEGFPMGEWPFTFKASWGQGWR